MEFRKNDIIKLYITDIGDGGVGIGKLDGFTVFVKDALPEDEVEARLTKVKKTYAYGRLERILAASPHRIKAPCSIHRSCGGCQLQPLDYKMQLVWKQKKIKDDFIRIGGFDAGFISEITEPVIGMEDPFRYRNKAQYPFGTDKNGRVVTGFYAGRTHDIIPNMDCMLGADENAAILRCVVRFMEQYGIKAYDENTGGGLVRHALIRKGFATGELMVCLVINGQELPHAEALIAALREIPGMTSISVSPNTSRTNVIMGECCQILWGSDVITDQVRLPQEAQALRFRISPLSFYQVNPVRMERLYGKALEYAALTGRETVWDLYCGIGTISLFLAGNAAQVYGVEVIPQAIDDAKENARINGIENASFLVGKAEEVLPEFYAAPDTGAEEMRHPDVIVVDPPRKGCDAACLDTVLRMQPNRIVYVSCDPATLARDVRSLCEGGVYQLEKICPVDMFPQTEHVETVVLMSRVKD